MKRAYIFAFTLVVFTYLPVSATIINIPDDYSIIQEGIDASTDGDTVLVQPGTYVENINFNGHNIVLGSLFLTTGDTTYIAETVIDGDSSGSVVTFENGEDSTAVITGFTIRNGYALDGGGIYCLDSNPLIRYNYIIENIDDRYGGGIYCYNASPRIKNNVINNNNGSAIFCHFYSSPLIVENIIDQNSGGGIRCKVSSDPIIYRNLISRNTTRFAGGGIYLDFSDPIICRNLISRNTARNAGGGIYLADSSPVILNNTIAKNITQSRGGGIYCNSWSNPQAANLIMWGDSSSSGDEIYGSNFEATFCNIEGGWEGEGNIDVDPLFRDPENGDFHLMATDCGDPYNSPCIDAGSPAIIDSLLDCSWGLGTILSDMGAYGGGDSVMVSIDNEVPEIPNRFAMAQNYPNPFNAMTVIRYSLPSESDVTIEIYDILGRRVQTLLTEKQPAGYHQIVWDASNHSSGLYFYRIQAGEYSHTKKMLLLR